MASTKLDTNEKPITFHGMPSGSNCAAENGSGSNLKHKNTKTLDPNAAKNDGNRNDAL